MKRTSKKLFFKITIACILFIVTIVGSFLYLLFWNSSYKVKDSKISSNLTQKVFEAQINGKAVEISSDELNSILNMYFKKGEKFKGITLKGIETEFQNNNIKVNIPISYKGYNFLVSSECYLSYKGNNTGIEIKPIYLKVGKISVPTNLLLEKFKSKLPSGVTTDNKSIFVDKKLILLEVSSLEIKQNKLLLKLEKLKLPLEEKLKSLKPELKNKLVSSSNLNLNLISSLSSDKNTNTNNNKEAYTENISTKSNNTQSASNNAQNTSKETNTTNNDGASYEKNNSEVNAALNRVNSGLNAAMGSVSTGGQRTVISQIIGAANSGNPYAYSGSIRSTYNTLSPQEKAQLKVALFSNVNSGDVNLISQIMGK